MTVTEGQLLEAKRRRLLLVVEMSAAAKAKIAAAAVKAKSVAQKYAAEFRERKAASAASTGYAPNQLTAESMQRMWDANSHAKEEDASSASIQIPGIKPTTPTTGEGQGKSKRGGGGKATGKAKGTGKGMGKGTGKGTGKGQ